MEPVIPDVNLEWLAAECSEWARVYELEAILESTHDALCALVDDQLTDRADVIECGVAI
jgi:hypothetical protein